MGTTPTPLTMKLHSDNVKFFHFRPKPSCHLRKFCMKGAKILPDFPAELSIEEILYQGGKDFAGFCCRVVI